MPSPAVTIFTCSYNKPEYVSDAINSVLSQTFSDFEYIVLENSDDGLTRNIVHKTQDRRVRVVDINYTEKERKRIYVESRLKNNYFPQAKGTFIMVLADDDVLEPTCFAEHLKEFEKDKKQMANFHAYRITYMNSDHPEDIIRAVKTFGPHRSPLQRTDGGAVMFNKELLKKIPQPFFKCNWHDAHISDGLFLNKLARAVTIYPINKILHVKRVTKVSVNTFIDDAGIPRFYRPQYGWKHLSSKLNI